jgi:hypothetical protein
MLCERQTKGWGRVRGDERRHSSSRRCRHKYQRVFYTESAYKTAMKGVRTNDNTYKLLCGRAETRQRHMEDRPEVWEE